MLVFAGSKDLPVLARSAGLVTGRAATYLSFARKRLLGFAEETEVHKVFWQSKGPSVPDSIEQVCI